MKRKRALSAVASVIIAAMLLLGVGIAQARWAQIAGIFIVPEKVCTDGVYVGLARDLGSPNQHFDVAVWSGSSMLAPTTTMNLPYNVIGTPPMWDLQPDGVLRYVGFAVLRWTPLTPGQQITITLSSEGGQQHWPTYSIVNNCSLKDFPGGSIVHACSNDIPKTLVTSTISSLPFSANLNIEDVDIQMYITHTWDSDVVATLVSPDGTSVQLFGGIGGNGDNFGSTSGYANINPNFYLDDEGQQFFTSTLPPFIDYYGFVPQSPLSTFDRKSASGEWRLILTDTVPSLDQGRLLSWCLNVNGYYVNNLPLIVNTP